VSEEQRKRILQLYCEGKTITSIAETMGLSKTVVGDVKLRALDEDTQFANDMFKLNFRRKLQQTASSALERVEELMPEMEARDAVLAFDKAANILMEMEAQQKPEIGSVNLHLHSSDNDLAGQFLAAMGEPKQEHPVIDITPKEEPRPPGEKSGADVPGV
jgi:transposase-like protein